MYKLDTHAAPWVFLFSDPADAARSSNPHRLKQTFKKTERLKSKRIIDDLFRSGHSIRAYPIRLLWMETELPGDVPVQFSVSVPKRNFKNAVDRNLLKRRMREAIRLNKSKLCETAGMNGRQYALMVLYSAKEITAYDLIASKICASFDRLIENP